MPAEVAAMADFAFLAGAAAALVASAGAQTHRGQEIAEHGSKLGAPPCVACHGPKLKGDSSVGTPAIAGLPANFIVQRLDHYAGPAGHNAMMREVASDLSPAERQQVAAYLSSLPKSP
jgi:cytochrome c553